MFRLEPIGRFSNQSWSLIGLGTISAKWECVYVLYLRGAGDERVYVPEPVLGSVEIVEEVLSSCLF